MTLEALDNISCDIEPVADSHLANKAYVDAAVAAGAGTASVSGDSVVSIPAHSLISCDIVPTEDAHLVNKAYVDAAVAAAGTATPIEEPAALGRVVYVTTLSDAASHTGTSLRDAIRAVTDKGSVVIKFSVSGTITLEQGEIAIPLGHITIDGEDKVTISGGDVSRVFNLNTSYSVLVLRRLEITNGNGVGATDSQIYGGAILLSNTYIQLICDAVTFRNNYINGGSTTNGGGAVGCTKYSCVVFEDCCFEGNYVDVNDQHAYGGAIYVVAPNATVPYNAIIHIVRSTFTDNWVQASGSRWACGGALSVQSQACVIQHCNFSGNAIKSGSYQYGGAIFTNHTRSLIIDDTVFSNNSTEFISASAAVGLGGAVCAYMGIYYLSITGCTFTQNAAYSGGALDINNSDVNQHIFAKVLNCIFDGNISRGSSDQGVAIRISRVTTTIENCDFVNNVVGSARGIIYCYGYTGKIYTMTINRCKFHENSSSAGTTGLVYCANLAQVYICNSVFTDNTFTSTTGNHKCVYTTGANTWAFIYNCTFTNNDNKGGAFYAAAGGVNIYNSVEYGNGSASGKGTNATVNAAKFLSDQSSSTGRDIAYDSTKPLFAADGYTPVANSQVIDAGNDTYAVTEYDLPGKARVSGTKVDLGAVEYQQGS